MMSDAEQAARRWSEWRAFKVESTNWQIEAPREMGPSDRIECAKQLLRLGKSVTEAAESAGYSSKSGFREMFQKLEGEDPFKWARDRGPLERVAATVRIAERLLVETNDPIGRIATSIGYTDRGLQKAFRKVHGITPGQWRAKNAP